MSKDRFKKKAIPLKSRRALAIANGCDPGGEIDAACWVVFSGLEIDHVVAERKGGDSSPQNLQLLCRPCNRRKGAK